MAECAWCRGVNQYPCVSLAVCVEINMHGKSEFLCKSCASANRLAKTMVQCSHCKVVL